METLGAVLVLFSIPLALRWVPRNYLYGFRVPVTLRSDAVWYDANAMCARHFILLGLLMVALEFVLPTGIRNRTLQVLAVAGLVGITAINWWRACQLERDLMNRQAPGGHSLPPLPTR
jgi:hypothetical protein